MELLMLLLLSPAIFAQNYQQSPNLNNEPFLPIYPTFPYSPKLIKRGIEKDIATPGATDSHTSKQDSRDSYSSSFGGNIQKNPYYSAFNSFSKSPIPPLPPFSSPFSSSSFNSIPFGSSPFGSSPFGSSPFPSSHFNANPYSSPNSYAGAFQNLPLTQSPSSFPQNGFPNYFQTTNFHPNLPSFYNQYPPSHPPTGADHPNRNNDDDDDNRRGKKGGRGRYKEDNEDLNDNHFTDGANFLSSNSKDLDGQFASLDYPATAYIKPHQLEQLMKQTLIKLLAQNLGQQTNQVQYPAYESNPNSANQNTANNGSPKSGITYVVNPSVINRDINQFSPRQTQQTQALIVKNQRYPETQYQKPTTSFISPLKPIRNPVSLQSPDYGDFDAQPSQVDQNYQASSNQEQRSNYQSQNHITQTPQSSSYQFSSYQPTPTPKLSDQRDLDDITINFGNKQKKKEG